MKLIFRAHRCEMKHGIDIRIAQKGYDENTGQETIKGIAELHLKSHEMGEYIEPTLKLDDREAQQLMDELGRCGVKPSDGTDSTGALKATQNHLEDMRKLVFKGQPK